MLKKKAVQIEYERQNYSLLSIVYHLVAHSPNKPETVYRLGVVNVSTLNPNHYIAIRVRPRNTLGCYIRQEVYWKFIRILLE